MRIGNFFVIGSCVIAIAMAVACTQRQTAAPAADDDDDTEETDAGKKKKTTTQPTQEEVDNSCLGKAHLAFDKAACTTCMSDSADCCKATITCFNDDKECGALQACMSKCGTGTTTTPGTTTTATTPQAAFAKVYASIQPTCGSCHLGGTGGAPIFFGADAEATRTLFKGKSYQLPNSILLTKGAHSGPALTPDQKTLITAWQTAEANPPPATGPGSGTGTGGGTGGGGGGGTGGGTGGGDGGADGGVVACQTKCKADHAAGLPNWQSYNNCSTVLCKSDCQ